MILLSVMGLTTSCSLIPTRTEFIYATFPCEAVRKHVGYGELLKACTEGGCKDDESGSECSARFSSNCGQDVLDAYTVIWGEDRALGAYWLEHCDEDQ